MIVINLNSYSEKLFESKTLLCVLSALSVMLHSYIPKKLFESKTFLSGFSALSVMLHNDIPQKLFERKPFLRDFCAICAMLQRFPKVFRKKNFPSRSLRDALLIL